METIYSELALEEADPERQMEALGGLLVEDDPLRGIPIPTTPPFEPQTPSEIMLLTCLMPGVTGFSATERTLLWIWEAFPDNFAVKVDTLNVNDLGDGNNKERGFRWVGFDPLGETRDAEDDFRADLFIGRQGARNPSGLSLVDSKRKPEELAGIEAFMALLLLPQLTHEAWGHRTVTLPRLEGISKQRPFSPGGMNFSTTSQSVHAWVSFWGYNMHGHQLAIPTLRELT